MLKRKLALFTVNLLLMTCDVTAQNFGDTEKI